jgi:hypothetical protein
MTRILKLIGLAGMAMLAMTAIAATSAQAVEFHAAAAPATITGEQEEAHKFTFNWGTLSCNTATFHGEQVALTAETLTISGQYSNCTFLGVTGVPFPMHGCDFVFHAGGTLDIVCPQGEAWTFEASGCKMSIGSQSGLSEVVFTNLGEEGSKDVTLTPNVSGITYTQTGILCPGGQGTFSNGQYGPGATTVVGEDEIGEHVDVWVE